MWVKIASFSWNFRRNFIEKNAILLRRNRVRRRRKWDIGSATYVCSNFHAVHEADFRRDYDYDCFSQVKTVANPALLRAQSHCDGIVSRKRGSSQPCSGATPPLHEVRFEWLRVCTSLASWRRVWLCHSVALSTHCSLRPCCHFDLLFALLCKHTQVFVSSLACHSLCARSLFTLSYLHCAASRYSPSHNR